MKTKLIRKGVLGGLVALVILLQHSVGVAKEKTAEAILATSIAVSAISVRRLKAG